MSTPAPVVNLDTANRRQEAAETQPEHLNTKAMLKRQEELEQLVNSTFDELYALSKEQAAINNSRKAALDAIEAKGIDRGAFKAVMAIDGMSEEERTVFISQFRWLCKARKYASSEQIEMFGPLANVSQGKEPTDEDQEDLSFGDED